MISEQCNPAKYVPSPRYLNVKCSKICPVRVDISLCNGTPALSSIYPLQKKSDSACKANSALLSWIVLSNLLTRHSLEECSLLSRTESFFKYGMSAFQDYNNIINWNTKIKAKETGYFFWSFFNWFRQ